MTSELSLRERKKLATRAALSQAAWSLMVAHGLDQVTAETVAAAADVSPRTFRNYFNSPEEAILDAVLRRGIPVADDIRARPVGEPVWESLLAVMPIAVPAAIGARTDLVVLMRAIRDNPPMLAQHLVVFEHGHLMLAEVIAERTGTDVRRDLAPRLLASVVVAALRTSIELWAEAHVDVPLSELIRESLAQLRAGLPLGVAAPTV
jgi:AcrR family transcriptional regulator